MLDIVLAARGWIGTRYAHQGRLKAAPGQAGACDCLGLLIGVAKELGLVAAASQGQRQTPLYAYDELDYGRHPDSQKLQVRLQELLLPVAHETISPGDIALFTIDGEARHLGIISDYKIQGGVALGLIHAYAPARAVVEHRLDEKWRNRLAALYRIPSQES